MSPRDFGVFAVALVVHSIVVNVAELGVTASLIRDTDEEVHRSAPTVVTIALTSSGLLALAMLFTAPQLATLLGNSHASGVVAVMSLTVFLAGPSAVPFSLLRRNFRMDRLFVTGLANFLVSGAVIIVLASRGWGPMALAWSRVAGQVVETVLLLWLSPTRYRPGFRRDEVRRLLAFGLPLAGANILSYRAPERGLRGGRKAARKCGAGSVPARVQHLRLAEQRVRDRGAQRLAAGVLARA